MFDCCAMLEGCVGQQGWLSFMLLWQGHSSTALLTHTHTHPSERRHLGAVHSFM